MATPMLNIKHEDIDTYEKRQKYTITIVGCRQLGILHSCLFAEVGFRVICVDADQNLVNGILKGRPPFSEHDIGIKIKNYLKTGLLDATVDMATSVSKSDVVVITLPAEIDDKKKVDYSAIENACKRVGSNLRRGSLVILITTVGISIIENVIKNILENVSGFKVGVDFGLAYSPMLNGQECNSSANKGRIVAAMDKNSLNAASTILETITKGFVKKIENIRMAGAIALFEAILRDIKMALANEIALFCERTGLDYFELHKLKIGSYFEVPPPNLSSEGINGIPYILLEEAENLNMKLRILEAAREINEGMIKHALNLTKEALKACGKTLRRARISLLGISQTQNARGTPKKIMKELIKMLETKGAKISIYDPYVSEEDLAEIQCFYQKNLTNVLEGADCILILTGHDQFKRLNLKKLKLIVKMPAAIVDFEGIIDPEKVEKEGLIYRGLGRGLWTK